MAGATTPTWNQEAVQTGRGDLREKPGRDELSRRKTADRARDDLAAPAGGNADMVNLTRRSVLRTSLALGAAGALARPYVAKAAATTATVWWTQGYAQEEDISFKANRRGVREGHWQ